MNHMLETLNSPHATQGGENAAAESISKKDRCSAYLAGIVDGEGCIHARFGKQTNPKCKGNNTLRVGLTIYNTHPLIIKKVTECLIELGIKFTVIAGKRAVDRPGANVVVEGKGRLQKLLALIAPHLSAKQKQAELALELIAYRESLAIHGRESKGRFGNMKLSDDTQIKKLVEMIKREKHEYPSVFYYPRRPNQIFAESSTTLRSPVDSNEIH